MSKTLSVAAIENGTVIDHITSDQTLTILHMLQLLKRRHKVTVGFNLPSKQMGLKDIIKVENHYLAQEEANHITIFAPSATINIIRDFKVIEKINTELPESISGLFQCGNSQCVTLSESVKSHFILHQQGKMIQLRCHYCREVFDRNSLEVTQ